MKKPQIFLFSRKRRRDGGVCFVSLKYLMSFMKLSRSTLGLKTASTARLIPVL